MRIMHPRAPKQVDPLGIMILKSMAEDIHGFVKNLSFRGTRQTDGPPHVVKMREDENNEHRPYEQ
jgi:hypothetical protein